MSSPERARLAIQCRPTPGAAPATFLYRGDITNNPTLVSPPFPSCIELFAWCRTNGDWRHIAGTVNDYVQTNPLTPSP
jgi:hypothetical protein